VGDGTARPGLAIGFTPFEARADVIVRVAQLADRSGYDGFGLAEAMGNAAPLVLAEIALTTTRLELSTSVLSVWSRTPATLAMTAMGLQRISGGRFVLGLGASTPELVEGLHGVPWTGPVGKLRSVMQAVSSLLKGQRLPEPAEGSRPLRLAVTTEPAVPLALAALSPPAVRLAGELADRWLPFLWPRSHLDVGRRLLEEGAAEGKRSELPQTCPAVPLAVGPDDASAERAAARWLTVYCTRMGSIYPRLLRDRFGYAAEVDALLAANVDREVPVLPAAARRLAEDTLVLAPYEDAAAAAHLWMDAGADRVNLSLPLDASEEDLSAAVLATAPAPDARTIAP
jgi:alkanesulfonate monooxygenase SsuD/methylene tetrahydromethanopterin reductase-like flavin-dependent oxidoreductase (luciferase family)